MNVKKIVTTVLLAIPLMMASCSQQSAPRPPLISFRPQNIPLVPRSTSQMKREVVVQRSYMPTRTRARRNYSGSMNPRFITIHSTANPTGDASSHSRYLNTGKSGSLSWHYTVDQYWAIQHLPLNRMGHHADRGGPGDHYSIAIEMCETRSHNPVRIYDKAAKLTAVLMKEENIPLRNVVPHYYWSRKNCPRPLLDHGRPGYKWSWFISRVDYYSRCLNAGM
ncbi:MAG: N-acetylmuramoyl-L-alanine amidase [Akkermansia sp.]